MTEVRWTKEAIAELKSLDKAVAKRIIRKISWFSENFSNITPEPLSGELAEALKFRIGDWRIIYKIENNVITIFSVGHRKEIYKTK